jgi:CMP-2-keto-3-deoxyoctulosonic acid synthetase
VIYKERKGVNRVLWFIGIMAFGNMAMSIFVLKELYKLNDEESLQQLLVRHNE